MNSFLINSTFLNTVSKLRKHFDNTQVSEIRITSTTIECYNKDGQNDIRIKDVSDRPLKEIVRDKWEDRVVYIRNKIQKFPEEVFKYVWKSAKRVYKLYKTRGVHNLLTVQHTTTNTLNKLSVNDYSLLLSEAHKVREEELNMFLGLFTPFAEAQASLISFAEAQV
ncbi:hypothetical protein C2G38_2204625 [Gigaspora rosea]|uniref:Uncharacterized protein n=1 Tax=Gigaspora rosea TaxID=44941 RepID=A0A397UUY2_9GLOM|nr:hypothetical protein C2G38_2204625 [Gigaspora rosea]